MKLKEMVAMGRVLAGEEGEVSFYATQPEQARAVRLLTEGINTAYRLLARDRLCLVMEESITLGEEGRVSTATLSKEYYKLAYCRYQGSLVGAREELGSVRICLPEGSRAELGYYYIPAPLSGPEEEPLIPEGTADHRTFVYYALSLYCGAQKAYAEAQNWDWRYRSLLDALPPPIYTLPPGRWQ